MTTTIVILAYIISVFLNRWLNKIMWIKHDYEPLPALWFVPILSTLTMVIILIYESLSRTDNWFTGKNW